MSGLFVTAVEATYIYVYTWWPQGIHIKKDNFLLDKKLNKWPLQTGVVLAIWCSYCKTAMSHLSLIIKSRLSFIYNLK